ncbi:SWIM-type domain-containing protein [Trichonephila clavipes]|nr:SWIM-type domain-containing protein [Trichonephila clavipes]
MAHSIGSKPLLLKNFNLHEILNYSVKFSSATGNRSVAANISKGLKLFDDKFVSKISFTEPDFLMSGDFFIQGFVKAEMKKKVTYKPSVQIRTCQVISATCTCPAGGTPAFCKHVFALLHAINDYIAKKLKLNSSQILKQWTLTSNVDVCPRTVRGRLLEIGLRGCVMRRTHEEFSPQCLKPTVKYPTKMMVWGCMSSHGVGRLHIVSGTVD